ncbi:MAG: helix-turn-helix transcriptional regulator [Halothece sp.]
MSSQGNSRYNQIAFALEILKLIAEKPRKRDELAELLSAFLEQQGIFREDIPQKLTRTIRQLRDCGFRIKSAPHHPYELVESNLPLLLSQQQRQALYMAAHFLADMGFSEQAGQILRIGNLTEADFPPDVKGDFSPPVDYSHNQLSFKIQQLQQRFERQYRYTIRYEDSQRNEQTWDLDRSELRLHNGVLYLFALVPDAPSYHLKKRPNVEQNRLFRIDRIKFVGAASSTRWFYPQFPTLNIRYRMSGPLAKYQPRRGHERVIERNREAKYVDIETTEDHLFWFRQRVFQYGANAQVLEPQWLAEDLRNELEKAYLNYGNSGWSIDK